MSELDSLMQGIEMAHANGFARPLEATCHPVTIGKMFGTVQPFTFHGVAIIADPECPPDKFYVRSARKLRKDSDHGQV